MTRQDLIPPLTAELALAYRMGVTGRRFFTREAAYLAAARAAYHGRYHEPGALSSDAPFALTPEQQERSDEHRRRIVERLARWLRWRDGRRTALEAR